MLENLLKSGNLAIVAVVGIGAYLLWPLARPAAKAAIKGGMMAADAAQATIAGIGEAISDLYAEASAELYPPAAEPTAEPAPASPTRSRSAH